jgi:pectinesterase
MKRGLLICLLFVAVNVFAQTQKIVVAQDGSGQYKTVQEAFNAIPLNNQKPITVFVKKGVYKERLLLDSTKNFVTLVGEDKEQTILTYNNHVGMPPVDGKMMSTPGSASFFIYAGDFIARNITFQNDAGFTAGQAVAVFSWGDKLVFDNCRFVGFQDVLYTSGPKSRQYYRNCYIEGTTDFIFGPATCVFQDCLINSKKNSHVTAAGTTQDSKFGYVFFNCKLTGDTSLHNVSLGRPWRPYAAVAYIHCNIGPHIKPEGWSNWNQTESYKTARYSEYKNTGPGANLSARVSWSRQLTDDEVKIYTLKNILGGPDNWDPIKELKSK